MSPGRLAPVVVVVAVLACFSPAIGNGFVWDDRDLVAENARLGDLDVGWMFTNTAYGHYQPLTWLSYIPDVLIGQGSAVPFHVTNILIHAAAALALYFLLLELLGPRTTETHLAAAFGALVFALHPLRVESVAWVTARRDVLSGLFFILSLWAYVKRKLPLSIGAAALCFLCKAWGMALPLVLLAMDICPLRRPLTRAVLLEKVPFALLAAASFAVTVWAVRSQDIAASMAERTAEQRLTQAGFGLCFYPVKTLAPINLSPLYPFGSFEPSWGWPIAAVGVTVVLGLAARRAPWAAASWFCYGVLVAPMLGLVSGGPQLVADRYAYLSLLPVAALAAFGFRAIPRAVAVALLIPLGMLANHQTTMWKDNRTLWDHVVATVEPDAFAWFNHGAVRHTEQPGDAVHSYERAIALDPTWPPPWENRGEVRYRLGQLEGAHDDLTRALTLNPKLATAAYNRALVRRAMKNLGGAREDLANAAALDPKAPLPLVELGSIKAAAGDTAGARADFAEAIRRAPRHAEAYLHRGRLLAQLGDADAALEDFRQAVILSPGTAEAYFNRGEAKVMKGDVNGAIEDFGSAVRLKPTLGVAWLRRGVLRAQQKNIEGAYADFDRAIKADPKMAEAWYYRGVAKGTVKNFEGATADLDTAIRLNPDYANAYYARASIWFSRNEKGRAAEDLRRSIEVAPRGWDKKASAEEILRSMEP